MRGRYFLCLGPSLVQGIGDDRNSFFRDVSVLDLDCVKARQQRSRLVAKRFQDGRYQSLCSFGHTSVRMCIRLRHLQIQYDPL